MIMLDFMAPFLPRCQVGLKSGPLWGWGHGLCAALRAEAAAGLAGELCPPLLAGWVFAQPCCPFHSITHSILSVPCLLPAQLCAHLVPPAGGYDHFIHSSGIWFLNPKLVPRGVLKQTKMGRDAEDK